jgi:hypothetical protein
LLRLICITLIWVIAFWKSDWRNWEKYHSTILFMIAGNFFVGLITYEFTLWDLSSELGGHLINDFLIALIFFPASLLIYFTHFPKNKNLLMKILYMAIWAIIFTIIEFIQFRLENIHYFNGWNAWKSLLLNLAMFPVLTIHHFRPLLAYFLYSVEVILLITICDIPISGFK